MNIIHRFALAGMALFIFLPVLLTALGITIPDKDARGFVGWFLVFAVLFVVVPREKDSK